MLRDEASRRGASIEHLIKALLEASLPASNGSLSCEEELLLDELAELGRNLRPPPAMETYSRGTIYSEHG